MCRERWWGLWRILAPFEEEYSQKPKEKPENKIIYLFNILTPFRLFLRSIFYGDMSGLSVKFSEELNVDVLRERYADEHAIGVIGWVELDGRVSNQQKIAVLVMAS